MLILSANAGRNPQTGETIAQPSRKAVVFSVSKAFRAERNK